MADASVQRPIVGVSAKMYFSLARTRAFTDALLQRFGTADGRRLLDAVDVFVLPDFVALPGVVAQLAAPDAPPLLPGAQDCGWTDYGAFSGVVSPAVLADLGVRIVMLGHAERRRLLGETDATTALKAAAVARHSMVPLVCVGEGAQGTVAAAVATVVAQVVPVLAAVPDAADVVLAYEPVWAIGAAQPAAAAYVCDVVTGLRTSDPVQCRRGRTRIVYGGSAGPGLFGDLAGVVDGLFLGRFGHDPDVLVQTVREVAAHVVQQKKGQQLTNARDTDKSRNSQAVLCKGGI